jgi:hypothetical protein
MRRTLPFVAFVSYWRNSLKVVNDEWSVWMETDKRVELTATPMSTRKPYRRPQLVEYGRVGELTKGGAAPNSYEDVDFFYSSVT